MNTDTRLGLMVVRHVNAMTPVLDIRARMERNASGYETRNVRESCVLDIQFVSHFIISSSREVTDPRGLRRDQQHSQTTLVVDVYCWNYAEDSSK